MLLVLCEGMHFFRHGGHGDQVGGARIQRGEYSWVTA
ncbi:MAG: DUF2933 domain-containing protein [Gammaproteobacteria bacterium]